jgi:hypothetical protein
VILTGGTVSTVLLMALVPAVVRAVLLAFVTIVAVRTHDEDRRTVAVVVLRILAPRHMAGPEDLAVLRSWMNEAPATTDERHS